MPGSPAASVTPLAALTIDNARCPAVEQPRIKSSFGRYAVVEDDEARRPPARAVGRAGAVEHQIHFGVRPRPGIEQGPVDAVAGAGPWQPVDQPLQFEEHIDRCQSLRLGWGSYEAAGMPGAREPLSQVAQPATGVARIDPDLQMHLAPASPGRPSRQQ
ncbi:MAG: hypothetical protein WDN31_01750 [Hyphomicrobium sp.]